MKLTVEKHYLVLTAETIEDAAKVAQASLLLQQQGQNTPLLAYTTIEIPLAIPKKLKS